MSAPAQPASLFRRAIRVLRPGHEHTAFTGTLLIVGATMLSRVIGLIREQVIAWQFGADPMTDTYIAAFTLPDLINHLLAGGTASITFVAMLTRYSAEGREEDARTTFSTVLTVVSLALLAGVAVGWLFARDFVRWWFPEFTPAQVEMCTYMTRVILPTPLFFVIGGVSSAVLMVRKQFFIPSMAPLVYNVLIILGGLLLGGKMGVAGLAYGALAGAFLGPFLINAIGASRAGMKYTPMLRVSHPGFRQWIKLSAPLMFGVSLVFADDIIMRRFASGWAGDITRLNYSKRLISVPISLLGQAIGMVSLPFFSRLWSEKRFDEFASTVNAAVYRAVAVSLLMTAWLVAVALPAIDLVFRRGQFDFATDATSTAIYFFWFALALAFWAAQPLYARAFYGAGDTFTPMVAGTAVTVAALPLYWWLAREMGPAGLAIASGLGIAMQTAAVAALLHSRGMVPLGGLDWREIAKVASSAVFAAVVSTMVGRIIPLDGSYRADILAVALISVTWAGAVAVGLWTTGSELPRALRRS